MPRIVFVLVPSVHLLEVAAPAQVFSIATDLGCDYRLHYVSDEPEVRSVQGLSLNVDVEWPPLTADDLVVVPGWRGPERMIGAGNARRLREHHAAGGTVAGICAGADALGRAGLLDGRRCTTHHAIQEDLARAYPATTVVRDVLYVSDDRIVTCAGVASATDLALHLVSVRNGPVVAAAVARTMVVYAGRDGGDPQLSPVLRHRSHVDEAVHRIQDLIDGRFTERLPLSLLAKAAGCSERSVTRLFRRAIGTTPLAYQQILRLERAEHLIDRGATVDAAAREVGFTDARMLRTLRARKQHERG
ncbi:DJ-1/PfpI family protein [Catellatospora sp. NPDC049609]|uniref:GlxA family transcriptional regulator n=1 Tax=Catellatospora sp. NPDC049609 TaxID=3155505 RepID=UPI003426F511